MPGFVRMAWRCGRKRTTAALPLPRSALLYWTPISTTSRLRWFSKERAGGRSATSRAFFRNSESLAEPHIAQWGLYDPHIQELSRCGQAGQRMRAVIPSFDLIWDWDHGG